MAKIDNEEDNLNESGQEESLDETVEEEFSEKDEIEDTNEDEDEDEDEEAKERKLQGILTFSVGFLAGIIVLSMVTVGSYLISAKKRANQLEQQVQSVKVTSEILDEETVKKLMYIESVSKILYYDDVDNDKLRDGLYQGLLSGLGDPYACYYSVEDMQSMNSEWSGTFAGIGAVLSYNTETGTISVDSFISGGSAEESGLQIGDVILAIDDEKVDGYSFKDNVAKIEGEVGTTVKLSVQNDTGTYDYVLERRVINSSSVSINDEGNAIYTIDISEFVDNTPVQFVEALNEAKDNDAKGLIIDLRGNSGGNLDSVVEICDAILPEGDIVYVENKNGEQTHYKSEGKTPLDIPLVVLIDGSTASAAEIMAGAIRDYHLGTTVGTTTYGKGIVQSVMTLYDGSAIKLTTSTYYTPCGDCIHKKGITPDIEVKFDAAQYILNGTDNQKEKAIEQLLDEIEGNPSIESLPQTDKDDLIKENDDNSEEE